MIKQYLLVLLLTYIEYFTFLFFLEHSNSITWEGMKFWLKYPPFICLFFFLIDNWLVATMIYITFSYPYLLMAYCMKKMNKEFFDSNSVVIKAYFRFSNNNNNKK